MAPFISSYAKLYAFHTISPVEIVDLLLNRPLVELTSAGVPKPNIKYILYLIPQNAKCKMQNTKVIYYFIIMTINYFILLLFV